MRILTVALLMTAAAWAQGTAPKQSAAGYPMQATLPDREIGAEYLVRSAGTGVGSVATDDYLVIEVAVYPQAGKTVTVTANDFRLRLNGKKDALFPQAPGAVTASIRYPDWRQRPQVTAGAGVGDGSIILGRPPAVGRFPGDPTANRLPRRPEVSTDAAGVERPAADSEDVIAKWALPEGAARHPVSGYLYFPYPGKLKSLRRIELLIQTSGEPLVLKIR